MRKNHSLTSIGMEDDYQSASLWEIFSRQIGSFIGIFIVFAVGAAAAALASWNFADPSLNNYAAETRPTNILGFWGASFADISMQFFGLGSVAALLPPFFWGLLLIAQKNIPRLKRRLCFLLLGLFTLSAACALLPPPQSWPMPIGLGGVVGDRLVGLFNFLPGAVSPFFTLLAALFILFPLAMIFAAYAGGVIFRPHGRRHRESDRQEQKNNREEAALFYPGNDNNIRAAGPENFAEDDEKPEKHERWHSFFGFILHHYLRLASFCRLHFGSRGTSGNSRAKQRFSAAGGDKRLEPYIDTPGAAENSALSRQQKIQEEAKTRQNRFFTALDTPAKSVESRQKPFILPSINYLAVPKKLPHNEAKIHKILQKNAQNLANVLEDFGVKGDIAQAYPGPVVTLYELEPAPGVKSSRIISLSDDIARSMSASSARIAVMNGRNALGIELPNQRREKVYLREILESKDYRDSTAGLALALGQSIGGETVIADLAKMPHLLVAGTTGSGKSVAINTMILSLIYRMSPQECRLIMVDPKMLELSVYDGIPHLLTPVVTDPKKALSALKWAVREMEDRYRKMAKLGVRNIDGFNSRMREAQKAGTENLVKTVQTGFDRITGEPVFETEELAPEILPYIVVIIDEMADLMMVAGKEIEGAVQRLAQMARAAGIHVIMATQRPSVDVITGTIKANFPTRISFQVTSKIDSRTILGEQGAEALLGQGDMLYMEGGGRIKRVHGPFVGDMEVERIVAHLKKQGAPEYLSAVMEDEDEADETAGIEAGSLPDSNDPYDKAVDIVLRDRKASTSYIQRRLGIGYNRAATIIERMEEEGVISAANHAGKREILVPEREAS